MECLDFLRELNIWSVMLRLTVAMAFGGLIGMERGKKRRAAGFRTYMLVCLGAALTMLLSQYEYGMLTSAWSQTASQLVPLRRTGHQRHRLPGRRHHHRHGPPGGEGPDHGGGPVGLCLHGPCHRRGLL